MTQNSDWHDKYFTPEQRQTMDDLSKQAYTEETKQKLKAYHPNPWTEEDQRRVDEQYRFVKQELGRLVAIGADPASPEAQHVAEVKHELSFSFSQSDPDIEASLSKWWEGFYSLPESKRPLDMTLYTYTDKEQDLLDEALEIYKKRQGIK